MVILILISALVVVGAVLKLMHRDDSIVEITEDLIDHDVTDASTEEPEVCCGLHEICSKSAQRAGEIIYFDDEELDRFAGRTATSYSAAETEEFRDVLLTLPPDEIAQWQESLTARGINAPAELRDEMIILLDEIALAPAKRGHID